MYAKIFIIQAFCRENINKMCKMYHFRVFLRAEKTPNQTIKNNLLISKPQL